MLVAMVVLMIGLLGLLTSINVAIQHNTQNQVRELAVGVGEEQMRTLLATPVDSLTAYTANTVRVCRPFRGYSTGFDVERRASALGSDSAEVEITVAWKQKGVNYQHQLRTIKSR
jgi:type IV pilus assembly protein PilV